LDRVFDSDALIKLRRAKGFSQEELAKRIGLSVATVSKLEEGRIGDPRGSTIVKLALGLSCRVDDLLSWAALDADTLTTNVDVQLDLWEGRRAPVKDAND
jgi:transcriptional regulator with XRE-family HTH domain